MISVAEARARITSALIPVSTEIVSVAQAAGRVLAEDVHAAMTQPPAAVSAMDGYAVRAADLEALPASLTVVGAAPAGGAFAGTLGSGQAVRIFTGAPMPQGPDTVLMQEDCTLEGTAVTVPPGIKRGANRRRAGEDVEAGTTILAAGRRLRAQDIGLAASVGQATLSVHRALRVALLSTGDEIREVSEALPPGCVYDANRYVIAGLLDGLGCAVDDLGILPDRLDSVHAALADAARGHDLIMTSGGVSTGEEDHVRAAVEAQGKIHFWRLAIRPGRPLALGQVGRVPFIGLPGNPVAVMVTFMRFARPAILRLAGAADSPPRLFPVRAAFGYRKKVSRREWLRVSLFTDEDGSLAVRKFPRDGAGILSSMVAADGLVELPEALGELVPGSMVDFLPFSEVS